MRYCLSISLERAVVQPFSFAGCLIRDFLSEEKVFQPEPYISLTALRYEREQPGLLEQNWANPCYDDERHFIFLAGSVLFRNGKAKGGRFAPTPEEVLDILLREGDRHYESLKGNYYLVLLCKEQMEASVYASPMSLFPAFAHFIGKHLMFSNYLEAFHAHRRLSIDPRGLAEFALFDHCLHNRAIYENVKLIPGGYCCRYSADGSTGERLAYDVADWYTPAPKPREEALEQINESLKSAIGSYVQRAGRFNIALTGGFDGRLNFSFIEKKDYPKLRAFSYGAPGSEQISIPAGIARRLGFRYEPVFFGPEFEREFPRHGLDAIMLSCGLAGFNRGMYPYAYGILKDFSRSCIIGQCDFIRPIYNNPAGVIFNEFSRAAFYGGFDAFKTAYRAFAHQSFLEPSLFTEQTAEAVFEEIRDRYITPYQHLDENLRYFFFLLRESIMKYWHTEFHLVGIFVDDYVPFADLDYLEALFGSAYAGIYKGLFARNQWGRRKAHDLYVDLMALNNDKLNYFFNDRYLKPGWLKYGLAGLALSAAGKQLARIRDKRAGNTTFRMEDWARSFYRLNREHILQDSALFKTGLISRFLDGKVEDSGTGYRFNRIISQKIWLSHLGIS